MKRLATFLGVLFLAHVQAFPDPCDTAQIQVIQHLSFGSWVVQPSGGRITLTQDGAVVPKGGVAPGGGPPALPARFLLLGPPGTRFSLKVDPQSPMLTHPRGGVVRVESFLPKVNQLEGVFDVEGKAEFKLGGLLDVRPDIPGGNYLCTQAKLQMQLMGPSPCVVNRSFTITATLRAPLLLTNTSALDFGGLVPGPQGGTFQVLPTGGHQSGGVSKPTLIRGEPHPASFYLQGPIGALVGIQLPNEVILTGPGAPMKVRGFTCSIPLVNTLGAGGIHFNVGGTLLLNPQQSSGAYKGVFQVTVVYL